MLLITDVIVSLFNIPVSGVEAFILAVFALTITSLVMNYVETGFDRKKAVYIMSDQLEMLKQRIRDETPHGLTVQPVVGGFSDENREMLMVVVEQSDFRRLIELIHGIDPDAFILTVAATEVHGGSIWVANRFFEFVKIKQHDKLLSDDFCPLGFFCWNDRDKRAEQGLKITIFIKRRKPTFKKISLIIWF